MPLLHQDTSRAGGGERPRSLADLLGLEPPRASEPVATPIANKHNGREDWRWGAGSGSSPPAAHTPRALVPAACFPPRHTNAYQSYSESARPGTGWDESSGWDERNGEITDLVASLKALAAPSAPAQRVETSLQLRLGYDTYDNNNTDLLWQSEQPAVPREERHLSRRASFCGVVSGGRRGEAVRWSGALPPRGADPGGGYSPKVFLGGLPWDISETALMSALRPFQPLRVEWPGREQSGGSPRGYAYVTFESERCVRALLAASRRDPPDWYYRIAGRKMRSKEVQVIPWAVCDSNWVAGGSARLEPARTVFVGALHGMLSAPALAHIMNDLFQGVVYAGIDTDKNKYPIGSGRVTFSNVHSYVRAISANYVEIRTDKFTKKVQVDPYLEDSMCSVCNVHQGPYFCRVPACFRYFCRSCWVWQHPNDEHKPLMRISKGHQSTSAYNGPNGQTNGPNGQSNGPNGQSHGPNGQTNGPMNEIHGPECLSNGPTKGLTNGPINGMKNGPINGLTNGPMTNGMSNGPMMNGPMTNGPMTNGPITNGPMTNGPMTNGPMTNGPMTNGPMTNGVGYQSPSDYSVYSHSSRGNSDGSGSPGGSTHSELDSPDWR